MPLEQDSLLNQAPTDTLAADSGLKTPPEAVSFRFSDEEEGDSLVAGDTSLSNFNSAPLSGPSIFRPHQLQPTHPNALPVHQRIPDWFTIILLSIVILFTWFRLYYYKTFRQLFSAWFNVTTSNQIVRDESVLLQRTSLILSVICYLLAGLYLFQLSIYFDWQMAWLPRGFLRFLLLAILVGLGYSLKMVFLRFISSVLGIEKPVAVYIFTLFLMIMMGGLLLLPLNLLMAYAPAPSLEFIIPISLGLLALLFVYRLVRASLIGIAIPRLSPFYLILYFCTFEIAPLLILWKLFRE